MSYVQWRRKLTSKHWDFENNRWLCKNCNKLIIPGMMWYKGEPLEIVNHIKSCYVNGVN